MNTKQLSGFDVIDVSRAATIGNGMFGNVLELNGRTPTERLLIGNKTWGTFIRFEPPTSGLPVGDSYGTVEFEVPGLFSIISSAVGVDPVFGLRDRADSADFTAKVNKDTGDVELTAGNIEGGAAPPYAVRLRLRVVTTGGANRDWYLNEDASLTLPGGSKVFNGAGSPEGAVAANVGSMYLRSDGGAGSTLYIKESGTGNTGWAAK